MLAALSGQLCDMSCRVLKTGKTKVKFDQGVCFLRNEGLDFN
jgi:hypothetical protein